MKLRRISIGVSDILIFELGTDAQRAIWNHVCDGTSCIDSEFDLSIKPLLAAHGVYDIHIKDMPVKKK